MKKTILTMLAIVAILIVGFMSPTPVSAEGYQPCDEMAGWWDLVYVGEWTWSDIEQDWYKVLFFREYDKYDYTHVCRTKGDLEWKNPKDREPCDKMAGWWDLISKGEWTWCPEEQKFYRVLYFVQYDKDYTRVCLTKGDLQWKDYRLCDEMGEWKVVSTGKWTWDPEKGDFSRIVSFARYDAYDKDHICDTKEETEWQNYQLCDQMTEWIVVSTGEWTWDSGKDDFFRKVSLAKYDAHDQNHLCQTKEETEWQGLCDECTGERIEAIPEEERGEWALDHIESDGTKIYNRPLTRDRHTGVICSWETKDKGPAVKCYVTAIIYGGWAGIDIEASVGGTSQPVQTTAINEDGEAQVTWIFWPPANTSWEVEVQPQTPAGKNPKRWKYRLVRISSEGRVVENPDQPVVKIRRGGEYVMYFQLVDTLALESADQSLTRIVEEGDTLGRIAREFGVSVEDILEANGDISDPDVIFEGQEIRIPMPVE